MSDWINKAEAQADANVQKQKQKEKLIVFGTIGGVALLIVSILILPGLLTRMRVNNHFQPEITSNGQTTIYASNAQVKELEQVSKLWKCLEVELKNHPESQKIKAFTRVLSVHMGPRVDLEAFDDLTEQSDLLRKKLDVNSEIWDYCKK